MYDFGQLNGWRAAWRKPDRIAIDQWLRRVKLGSGYAIQGPFRADTSRYLIEPLRAIQADEVREVSVLAAVQTGKTLVAEMGIAWASANAPGPIMWTMQSDEDGKEHAEGRFNAMLRGIPEIAAIMPTGDRHRIRTAETFFSSHYLLINGANKNNLQSKSIRWKFNSELWLWKEGLLAQARARVSAYDRAGTSKVVNESQGGEENTDWERAWRMGDCAVWSIPCESCGAVSPLEFFARMDSDPKERAGVIWDREAGSDHESTSWDVARACETARWRCPKCGHDHEDSARTRARWNNSGRYVATRIGAPTTHRSFHWNSLTCHPMAELVRMWAEACDQRRRGSIEATRNFFQQRLAIFWRLDEEREVFELTLGGYTLAECEQLGETRIEGEALRFMAIDRQRDHFWAVVRAWRNDGSSRLLWRGKALTEESLRDVQDKYGVEPQLTFEDAQHATAQVYDDCRRFGWTALHGSGDASFPWTLPGGAKVRRFYSQIKTAQIPGGAARYMHWASDPVKDILYALRSGKSYKWEVPDDADEPGAGNLAYSRQLSGDQKRQRTNKSTGRDEWRWVKIGAHNHYADCEAMQVVAAIAMQILRIEDTAQ